jgi:hypothetical protein
MACADAMEEKLRRAKKIRGRSHRIAPGEWSRAWSFGVCAASSARPKAESNATLLVGFFHLGRLAEVQNLPGPVAREHTVRALGFERNHRHFPRPRAVSHGDTPARQTLERFELESSGWPCP